MPPATISMALLMIMPALVSISTRSARLCAVGERNGRNSVYQRGCALVTPMEESSDRTITIQPSGGGRAAITPGRTQLV